MKDDIDLLLEDLQSMPESPEANTVIQEVQDYIAERESQQFEPEQAPQT